MTRNWRFASTGVAVVLFLAAPAWAADRPRFDAVSLRLQPDKYMLDLEQMKELGTHIAPGSVSFGRVSMKSMIVRAYGVEEFQIPAARWIENSYSGRATFPKETPLDLVPQMIRTMLEERFGLRVHLETKVVKVWLLEQAPGGAKLSPPSGKRLTIPGLPPFLGGEIALGQARRRGNADPEKEWLVMSSGTMRTFCALLSKEANRPVLDRTGLEGKYDVNVEAANAFRRNIPPPMMTPSPAAETPDPPLVLGPALKKLGLKFRESREPVELLSVDTPPSLSAKP